MDCKKAVTNIRAELMNYIESNGIKSLVLGVSGGIDSALVAAIAEPVCGLLKIPLIGISLPSETNAVDEVSRAEKVGYAFCTKVYERFINNTYNHVIPFLTSDPTESLSPVRRGNLKARLRMIAIYDLAQQNGGMVLSTDNFTELMEGFWTLHGDVGDYGMIQNLWKTEVYEISRYLVSEIGSRSYATLADRLDGRAKAQADALQVCIDAVPTDGLGISKSDLDQLGATTYVEVDKILKTWLTTDSDCFYYDEELKYEGRANMYSDFVNYRDSLKDHPVVQRHIRTEYKRQNPFNIPRNKII